MSPAHPTETDIVYPRSFRVQPSLIFLFMLLVFAGNGCNNSESETHIQDFGAGGTAFNPASNDIAVTVESGKRVPDDTGSTLRIRGTSPVNAHFAESDHSSMKEFRHYRLSAWIRAGKEHQTNIQLQCVFMTDDPRSSLGIATAEGYDKKRPDTWQLVTVEFRSPLGTKQCKLVLSPGNETVDGHTTSCAIDVLVDSLTLEAIDHYTIDGKYTLQPIPAPLEKTRNVHPRLFLTSERVEELRRDIKTTHAALWDEYQRLADNISQEDPPVYRDDSANNGDKEQLYMRTVGNNIPILSFAYVLSGEKRYLDSAVKWALASCGYPSWGRFEFEGSDLAMGHQLLGLTLLYDWCYHDLPDSARATIRATILRRGAYVFDAAAKGVLVTDIDGYRNHPWAEWDEAYLQNHLWINSCAIAAAGLALFDDVPETTAWIAFALDKYKKTMNILGDDGASHEGPSYWTYGVAWMQKFMYLSRELLDVDMYDNPWWQKTAYYRLYMSIPRDSWSYDNTTLNYGDSSRADSKGADYMLRGLASQYRNGYAQWLANAIDDADVAHPRDPWLNLLWYDPSVTPQSPSDLATLRHFTDVDIVSARSDWSGSESLLFFKCGPYLGHKAIHMMTYCPSSAHHVHPDVNSFILFGAGDWLMRDDGYHLKYTGYHNTLLIDNRGQIGEGGDSFDGSELHGMKITPRIIRAESTPALDHLTGDASTAYPVESGIRRYIRHLLFIKPDVLIVVDDIAMDNESRLELRFHPEQQMGEQDGNIFTINGEKALLRFELLTSEKTSLRAENLQAVLRNDGKREARTHPMYTIRVMKEGKIWTNAVALSWSKTDGKPKEISLERNENIWTFSDGKRSVMLDLANGMAKVLR